MRRLVMAQITTGLLVLTGLVMLSLSPTAEGPMMASRSAPSETITVVAPNGGETWIIGSTQTIQWTTTGSLGTVKIELSRDGGTTYEVLFASVPNGPTGGSQVWTVEGPASPDCQIKLTGFPNVEAVPPPTVTDTSNNEFTISQPSLTVQAPNGGESWAEGCSRTIQWSSSGVTGNVKIALSRNGGSSYSTLWASTANDGVESWTVTGPASTNCKIKISSVSPPSLADISNSPFTIATRSLMVAAPNGGENWAVGSTQMIQWTANVCETVDIDLSRDGGASWERLFTGTPNDGAEMWTVTGPASSQCLIRVSVSNVLIESSGFLASDISDAVCTISQPTVQITSTMLNPTTIAPGQVSTLTAVVQHAAGLNGKAVTVSIARSSASAACLSISPVDGEPSATQTQTVPSSQTGSGTLTFNFVLSVGTTSCNGTATYQATVSSASGVTIQPPAPGADQATLTIQRTLQVTSATFTPPALTLGETTQLQVQIQHSVGFLNTLIIVQVNPLNPPACLQATITPNPQSQSVTTDQSGMLTYLFPITIEADSCGGSFFWTLTVTTGSEPPTGKGPDDGGEDPEIIVEIETPVEVRSVEIGAIFLPDRVTAPPPDEDPVRIELQVWVNYSHIINDTKVRVVVTRQPNPNTDYCIYTQQGSADFSFSPEGPSGFAPPLDQEGFKVPIDVYQNECGAIQTLFFDVTLISLTSGVNAAPWSLTASLNVLLMGEVQITQAAFTPSSVAAGGSSTLQVTVHHSENMQAQMVGVDMTRTDGNACVTTDPPAGVTRQQILGPIGTMASGDLTAEFPVQALTNTCSSDQPVSFRASLFVPAGGSNFTTADPPTPTTPEASLTVMAPPPPQAPTLTGSSSVTRGQTATFIIQNVAQGAQIANWRFTDNNNNVVNRVTGTNNTSWSGIMVTSGTVSVTVVQGGQTFNLMRNITVNNRTNFALQAVSPTKKQNGFTTPLGVTLTVPSPPQPNDELGRYGLDQVYSFTANAVGDNGPNRGFKYVLSISNSDGSVSTGYYYVISPDLENTSSTFYQAQCGNYNAQPNTGIISGAQLLTNTIDHEANTQKNSHYDNYVDAQNHPSNNLGAVAEQEVGLPSKALNTFIMNLEQLLNGRIDTIRTATGLEPCGRSDVRLDNDCVFRGCINFPDAQGNYYPCQGTPPQCQQP